MCRFPISSRFCRGEALNDHGVYQGDNQALIDSVAAYELALKIGRASPDVRRDAALKGNMAIVLTQLGSRSGDVSHLDHAVRLYGEVAKALPRKRYPEDWAYTQLNLGALHRRLQTAVAGTNSSTLP